MAIGLNRKSTDTNSSKPSSIIPPVSSSYRILFWHFHLFRNGDEISVIWGRFWGPRPKVFGYEKPFVSRNERILTAHQVHLSRFVV